MRGLLLKDFYTLFKQAKIFILLIAVFSFLPGSSTSSLAVVYAAMLPITALAYDERAKWDSLAAMMPYKTRELVSSKYLLGYIAIGAAGLLSCIVQAAIAAVNKTSVGAEEYLAIFLVMCVASVLLSVNLPIMFRLGVERGRVAFMILVGLFVGAGVLLGDKLEAAVSAQSAGVGAVAAIAAAVTVAINLASVALSAVLYKRRRG